jgi:hypothetical protein
VLDAETAFKEHLAPQQRLCGGFRLQTEAELRFSAHRIISLRSTVLTCEAFKISRWISIKTRLHEKFA